MSDVRGFLVCQCDLIIVIMPGYPDHGVVQFAMFFLLNQAIWTVSRQVRELA